MPLLWTAATLTTAYCRPCALPRVGWRSTLPAGSVAGRARSVVGGVVIKRMPAWSLGSQRRPEGPPRTAPTSGRAGLRCFRRPTGTLPRTLTPGARHIACRFEVPLPTCHGATVRCGPCRQIGLTYGVCACSVGAAPSLSRHRPAPQRSRTPLRLRPPDRASANASLGRPPRTSRPGQLPCRYRTASLAPLRTAGSGGRRQNPGNIEASVTARKCHRRRHAAEPRRTLGWVPGHGSCRRTIGGAPRRPA